MIKPLLGLIALTLILVQNVAAQSGGGNIPVNDTCTTALQISCGEILYGSTFGATEDENPEVCSNGTGPGVWYSTVGDGSVVTLSTCDPDSTNFNTEIVVMSGSCDTLTCVGYNDNDPSCTGAASTFTFNSEIGLAYFIYVCPAFGTALPGNFALSMTCEPPCSIDFVSAGPTSDCDPIDNTYTVDITMEYISEPTTGNLLINDQWFPTTGSPQTETVTFVSSGVAADVFARFTTNSMCSTLEIDAFMAPEACNVNCAAGAINLLEEDFNNCALPTGWTNNILTGTEGYLFVLNTPLYGVTDNINGTCMAIFDDDYVGNDAPPSLVSLETPVIDLSTVNNTKLEFDYSFNHIGSEQFYVDVWDGSNWINVLTEADDNPGSWGVGPSPHASIDISAYNNSDFKVRFVYDDAGGWAWWIALDNVTICGVEIVADINEAINNGLSVYPNPSEGNITLELNGVDAQAEINVLDITGRTVYNENLMISRSFKKTFTLGVPKGTYVLQLKTNEGIATRKLQVN